MRELLEMEPGNLRAEKARWFLTLDDIIRQIRQYRKTRFTIQLLAMYSTGYRAMSVTQQQRVARAMNRAIVKAGGEITFDETGGKPSLSGSEIPLLEVESKPL